MDKQTPGNFGFGDMPADYRMRYKQMIEKHNKDKAKKKKKKNPLETIAEKLYGGSNK